MLAYDEKNVLCEYVEKDSLAVCGKCHYLYRRITQEQMPGFREREYDRCPYCGQINDSSMTYEYWNSALTNEEIISLEKKSLFDFIVNYCHRHYSTTVCGACNHPSGCPGEPCGNCKRCLEEIHYPDRYPAGRKNYQCDRMMDFYVCAYMEKYASEMLYLMRKSGAMKEIDKYHVLSLGCGACPDLMALEQFCHENGPGKTISYFGIDVNKRWKRIHDMVGSYKTTTVEKVQFEYLDVVAEDCTVREANVVILQYIISHFNNTGQIEQINKFYQKLIDNIVSNKQSDVPMVILINDANSVYRGREHFEDLVDRLVRSGFHGNRWKYYFDYNIVHPAQRYGEKHASLETFFRSPKEFDNIYQPWHECSSAQLLIEVQ